MYFSLTSVSSSPALINDKCLLVISAFPSVPTPIYVVQILATLLWESCSSLPASSPAFLKFMLHTPAREDGQLSMISLTPSAEPIPSTAWSQKASLLWSMRMGTLWALFLIQANHPPCLPSSSSITNTLCSPFPYFVVLHLQSVLMLPWSTLVLVESCESFNI